MHQTFYIDIDEEISSVVDRLNRSMAADNYFVVPKRAIFLQSIVNLKLLKREADKAGKRVILVTPDEIGTSMAHRSGIDVRPTLDGLEPVSDVYPESAEIGAGYEDAALERSGSGKQVRQEKQSRLKSLGSDEYYDQAQDVRKKSKADSARVARPASRRIPVNSIGSYPAKAPARVSYDISRKEPASRPQRSDPQAADKGKNLEEMFSSAARQKAGDVHAPKAGSGEGKTKKIFFAFIGLCLLALLGVAAYLFLPSAKVTVTPDVLKNKTDADIRGSLAAQTDGSGLAVRVIDQAQEMTLPYDVTGKSAASGKKAHGSVVIYNEYNSSPQALVATTRLESADGKIFRLVKSVTVPGTTVVGGLVQPGAIEAEVTADQAGSDHNIGPAIFTIPGFAGGPKFDKFYAKSTVAMTRGTSEGASTIAVSQQDLSAAKAKAETEVKNKIAAAIANQLLPGEVVLPEAEKIMMTRSAADVKIGDMVGSFDYAVEARAVALVFSENDVKKIVLQKFDAARQPQDAVVQVSKIGYGNVAADFDGFALDLKVHSEITITPNIDSDRIKKDILGKNADQLADILKKYPSIKNANVEFWPTFISRIPQYPQRVDVQIGTNDQ